MFSDVTIWQSYKSMALLNINIGNKIWKCQI